MGYYINSTGHEPLPNGKGKADFLIQSGIAKEIPKGELKFQPNLVCVVENFLFDAVAYAYSEQEMLEFANPDDHRPKRWLIVENADVLSGYKK
jgi:hypothetical protein